jgi:sialidase-1
MKRIVVRSQPLRLATLFAISTIFAFCMSGILRADPKESELHLDPRCELLPTKLLGPFVRIDDNTILAIDHATTYISHDDGQTWSEPRPLFDEKQTRELNIKVSNERAMLRTKEGTIIAAFMNLNEKNWTWNNTVHDAPGAKLPTYVMRSLDNGQTWQDIQKLHDDWSGAVRDMIQLKDGRVIFTAMKMLHTPGRHSVLTYSSTDDGATWTPSNLIDLGGQGHHGGVTESTITELNDGRVWMLIRTNWGEFWSGYSSDSGQSWRVLQPSGIAASSAPGMLRRLASGRLMLLWNRPFPEGKNEWPLSGGDGLWSETPVSNHREELSLAFSDDEGKTWTKPVVLAHQSGKWLAYPYVFEHTPGHIWLTTMQGDVRVAFDETDFIGK